jgi:hypothetical protein
MDRSLLDAVRNEDPRARKVLARWLLDELRRFYERRTHPVSIDDLIQESMTEIFATLSAAPDEPAPFENWVFERAGMRAKALSRDAHREQERIANNPPQIDDNPPHLLAESPTASILRPLLENGKRQQVIDHAQQLRPIYRHAILHVLGGGDSKSLAASAGVPRHTARRRLRKAAELVNRSIKVVNRITPPRYRTPPV